ncbi:hypothetical protein QFC19_003584 [Naganishia cerealis]|uniref:Uncharacterized protein n=1 Tax=Naganishia cerealis TaxID=610337 RepID=A0ACC2W165_9TREE|nr:hypothetical protein QFC19_003584 [Naganishia cerealis]
MFGHSTPVTPVTPRTTFTRPASSGSSAATPHSKAGSGNQRTRTVSSLTNSWITEPTESGITMSSWHFDSREEVPPVPALTASTKARYGVPASTSQPAITPLAHATAETTFYGEGPSIIRIGDPADMTFASYDSLPIKHGKRSTNFEILSPPAKSRPSKSPSVVSFRRRNRRTPSEDSEESFHSAVNDPTQSIESGGIRLYPNQSFPQSVSVSFEEVFCDAPGASAVDTASIRTDAIETVAKDEDERNSATGKTLEMHNRLGHLPSVPSNGQRQASAYASSSASEILMPISVGISGNPVIQPELPGMPKRSCGTYSTYSSRASPMFGMFIAGGEKNSTDPLLMRGKTSVASGAVGWPAGVLVDRQETTQPGIHNGTAGSPEELGNERQFRQLSWVTLCNLLMLWISFVSRHVKI